MESDYQDGRGQARGNTGNRRHSTVVPKVWRQYELLVGNQNFSYSFRGAKPHLDGLIAGRRAVDEAIERGIVSRAPNLMAYFERFLVASIHFGSGVHVHRPGVAAIAGEVDATYSGLDLSPDTPPPLRLPGHQ